MPVCDSRSIAHWVNHSAHAYVCSCPSSHVSPQRFILESIYIIVVDIVIDTAPGQGNLSLIFPVMSLEGIPVIWCSVALT